ncbi:hypothetical protein RF11_11539 [Thelohanellus kitauei]|uniref:Uncharacterized protein n=1 Tax=Thelohanellus kitauei TaxID=669202 RepID=A0A0C2NG72_THEKT|nr:hypothetical protein RF11_11539 [Thelohanellus kitauei]
MFKPRSRIDFDFNTLPETCSFLNNRLSALEILESFYKGNSAVVGDLVVHGTLEDPVRARVKLRPHRVCGIILDAKLKHPSTIKNHEGDPSILKAGGLSGSAVVFVVYSNSKQWADNSESQHCVWLLNHLFPGDWPSSVLLKACPY